jgi:hypothetical protein
MTDRELMQQALDALESSRVFVTSREKIKHPEGTEWYDERIDALRARLAQPEQEPVGWRHWLQVDGERFPQLTLVPRTDKDDPLYTAPLQREWQKLTDEEYETMAEHYVTNCYFDTLEYAKAIEAKLKEKNT